MMRGKMNAMPEDRMRTEQYIDARYRLMWKAWLDGDEMTTRSHGFSEQEALDELQDKLELRKRKS